MTKKQKLDGSPNGNFRSKASFRSAGEDFGRTETATFLQTRMPHKSWTI